MDFELNSDKHSNLYELISKLETFFIDNAT